MILHSYAMDTHNKAQDLVTMILGSSSLPKISAACSAIESFLHKHTADQSRSFFSIAFPALICKIFGFDDSSSQKSPSSSNGWVDLIQASQDSELAGRVFNLLSPSGVLITSISAVDRYSLVKYVFPVERLPEWSRYMLQNGRDCHILSDLCPLFKGRLKDDPTKGSYVVQLNVFEYYMFWFAYYPVSKGDGDNSDAVALRKRRRFRLENWTSSFPVLGVATRGLGQKTECSLYIRLLYAYLRAFVPTYVSNAHQPYRSSLIHYSSGYDNSILLQAEFFVYTLIHFWLVDNDFSPLSVNVCRSFGVSFPFRAVLGETPPTSALGEVVTLFVKYLNSSLVVLVEGSDPIECSGSPQWRTPGPIDVVKSRVSVPTFSYGNSVDSWNLLIQRPLYRFILRTFLFCPMGTSIKNAEQVFSLWIIYMEPWKISGKDFVELNAVIDQSVYNSRNGNAYSPDKENALKEGCQSACGYSSAWQGYVLSNYLFFSSLVMHFLGFAHKFLHSDAKAIVQMVLKILTILTSSRELIDLIKKVDAAFHSKAAGTSSPMLNSLYKSIPTIQEQLQDWEDGLCESDVDGSFLHENWNQDLRLFSNGEDGGHQLLQLLILRAEAEIQAISSENLARNLQNLDALKTQMGLLFGGGAAERKMSVTPEEKRYQRTRDEIFKPRRLGNHTLADIKFKGDWMKRPISDGEIAWLARILVRLSDWLNEILGLNPRENIESELGGPPWAYVELSNDEEGKVGGPKEAMRIVLGCICAWLLVLGMGMVRFMREHGLRVNLRVLASKKVVVFLFVAGVFGLLKKGLGLYLYQPVCPLASSSLTC